MKIKRDYTKLTIQNWLLNNPFFIENWIYKGNMRNKYLAITLIIKIKILKNSRSQLQGRSQELCLGGAKVKTKI